MAAKTDLTFAEINAEIAGACTFSTDDILISAKALTGKTYTALTDNGFLEVYFKLHEAGLAAQETVNVGLVEGEILDTFNPISYGVPLNDGTVAIVTSQDYRRNLLSAPIVGENI